MLNTDMKLHYKLTVDDKNRLKVEIKKKTFETAYRLVLFYFKLFKSTSS